MTRRFTQPPLVQIARLYRSWVSCTLLLALIFAISSLSTAAVGHGPPSLAAEQTGTSPRFAVVKSNANLRASPSLRGKILVVAKEGTLVQVFKRTGRWYWVKTEGGTEAWIHKTLVVLLNRPLRLQSELSEASESGALGQAQDRPVPQPSPTPPPEPSEEGHHSPVAEQPASPTPLPDDRTFTNFQNLSVYLAAGLLVGLLTAIGLRLRTTRQLKRMMRNTAQISHPPALARQQTVDVPTPFQPLNAVEEIHPVHPDAGVARLPDLPVELSPLERAVLEAIHKHGEVQEGELRKILENRGFPGVLIKAVIGHIVRKTGSDGPPWIRVRHAHGRYTYGLQLRKVQGPTASIRGDEQRQ